MIVMIAERQILSARQVCQNCLMSDRSGLPRWHGNELGCGKVLPNSTFTQAKVYQCQMGFNVTQIESD
jgi:hypothetical protein